MAKNKVRIKIPSNAEELLELATNINKKHVADGANSPLKSLLDVKWETEAPNVAKALAKHAEAEMYKSKMEACYKDRDFLMTNIPSIVRSSRDILKGINSKNPKRMIEWGFGVETSVAPKPKAKSTDSSI